MTRITHMDYEFHKVDKLGCILNFKFDRIIRSVKKMFRKFKSCVQIFNNITPLLPSILIK